MKPPNLARPPWTPERQPLPPGFVEVGPGVFEGPLRKVGPGVYSGRQRVTVGPVDPEDEGHNCDAMGCGMGEHVLSRETIDDSTKLEVLGGL